MRFRSFSILTAAALVPLALLLGGESTTAEAAVPCRSYDVRDGLSENSVRCLLQDRTGYIWFGTKDGLSRYNGKEFRIYGSSSLSHQLNIEFLLEHRDGGKIWIASRYSLELLDVDSGKLTRIEVSDPGSGRPMQGFRALCYDSEGRLWAGSNDGLAVISATAEGDSYRAERVFKAGGNDSTGTVSEHAGISTECTLPADNIGALLCDRSGNIWIGTESGLAVYSREDGNIRRIGEGSITEADFLCLKEDENGIIWAGTWADGLFSINPKDGSAHSYLSPRKTGEKSVPIIRSLYHNDRSSVIICSNSGLFEFDKNSGTLRRLHLSEGLPNDSFYSCIKDHEGGLWIGTYFNGAFYISPKAAKIELFRPDPNSLFSGTAVSEFCECGSDRLWVGTENGGLSLLDRRSGEFIQTRWHDSGDNVHAICQVGDELWVGTFSSGLKRINLRTGNVRRYYLSGNNASGSENSVYSLFHSSRDGQDRLYIGTKKGCFIHDGTDGEIRGIPELEGQMIYDILEDYTGKVWFSCHGFGLYSLDRHTGAWKLYRHDPEDPSSICSNRIIDIYADSAGQLWLCSEGNGICRYDYGTDTFSAPKVNSPSGKLPSNVIFGVLDDRQGRLWMSSNAGIIRLDPRSGDYRLYTHEDGLQSNQFNFKSSFKTGDGKMWFGGVNGFNAFYPQDIPDNSVCPKVTASVHHNGIVEGGSAVTIPSGTANFTIAFDCLSYVSPEKTVFEYKFERDKTWTRTPQSSVSFADLKPGKYNFLLRAVNSDGYASGTDCAIALDIREPWYGSVAAICIYVLLAILLASLGVVAYFRFRSKEERRRMEEMQLRNEQESYNAKIQFFTQIAHEIKTPVTLIQAPLEIVLEHHTWDRETEENLSIIEANTRRLTELTNQLLDFKKISNEGYLLHLSRVNIVPVAEEVLRRFSTAERSGIEMTFSCDAKDGYTGMFDPDAISKILSNLVENAVKYTRDKIEVSIEQVDDGKCLLLSVANNGPAIPKEEAVKIFDTFYQVDGGKARKPGFGIGLSLVSLLAEKSGGRAYVDTLYTEGCRFCVELPYDEGIAENAGEDAVQEDKPETEASDTEKDKQLTLLIVEDNTDILSFIADQLKDSYRVLKATDGQKALAKLEKQNVDIIVSDIAMPNMDGFELLKEVRENTLTSHIPFILLSAESSVESKIKGLDYGADAYIEKPFSVNHFRAVIDSLVNNRRALIEKFATSPEGSLNMAKYGTMDAQWLAKVDSIINANMTSVSFSVQQLAEEMFVSRSNIQRKMKALTGMTPNEYIRLIRLKKASELLLSDKYRINEVCYMCGFNTPSYFTTCFFKQFGILPKEFVSLHKAEMNDNEEE